MNLYFLDILKCLNKFIGFKLYILIYFKNYLEKIINKKIPTNPQIIYNIQEIFNYLPNFETESVIKAMSIQTNNNYLVLYLSWITKTIVALHKLINNKI